jgi:YVTN family beta-propeller protein
LVVGTPKTLKRAGIVAAIVAVAACFAAASASAAPLLLTGNEVGKSVSVINAQTNATVGEPIALESLPQGIAIVPGGLAYVAEPTNNSVTVINPVTRKKVKTIPVSEKPLFVAVSPDGKTVYVTGNETEDLTLIDTATNTKLSPIPVGGEPFNLAFAPNGKFAYVGVGDTLVTVDTAREEVVGAPIPVGETPTMIAFSPDGETAYVSEEGAKAVGIVNVALRKEVSSIPLPGTTPWGLAVGPDGKRLYVGNEDKEGTVTAFSTATSKQIGTPIDVGALPRELAFTPDGDTLYVADRESGDVVPIDTATDEAQAPIRLPGLAPSQLAVTPDLSPTAAFTAPSATATIPTVFSGASSVDPDGTIGSYSWAFGDNGLGTGVNPVHTYAAPGTYNAQLSVVDNEGCGIETVFTGRTAYCSGNPLAKVTHTVQVAVAPPPSTAPICSSNFSILGVSHNRKNGTVRVRLKFPTTGWFLLFGKKIHAVTRKVRKPGATVVTLHARVELNKALKKTLRAGVKYRVTFAPNAGCGSKTVHRSVALLRAPRKRHGHR